MRGVPAVYGVGCWGRVAALFGRKWGSAACGEADFLRSRPVAPGGIRPHGDLGEAGWGVGVDPVVANLEESELLEGLGVIGVDGEGVAAHGDGFVGAAGLRETEGEIDARVGVAGHELAGP